MNNGRNCPGILPAALALLIPVGLSAETMPAIDPGFSETLRLEKPLEVHVDRTRKLDLAGARALQASAWQQQTGTPAFGYTSDVIWLKFSVLNSGPESLPLILFLDYEYLDEIDLSALSDGQVIFQKSSGRMLPFTAREHPDIKFAFNIEIPPEEPVEIFLRIRSQGSIMVPVFLLSRDSFAERRKNDHTFLGVFLGIFLVLFFLNTILYSIFQDRNILFYLIYIFLAALYGTQLLGYNFKFLWPAFPVWNAYYNTIGFAPLVASALAFTQSFLRTRLYIPWVDNLFKVLYVMLGITSCLAFFLDIRAASAFQGGVIVPIALVLVFWADISLLRRGHSFVRFYIIGWILYLFCIIIYIAQIFNLAPPPILGLSPTKMPVIGMLIEMIFFPLALGDRILTLKRENENRTPETKVQRLTQFDIDEVESKLKALEEFEILDPDIQSEAALDLARRIGISREDLEEIRKLHSGFSAPTGREQTFFKYSNILYFSALKNKTILHGTDRDTVLSMPLKELETRLPAQFKRVHRKHIINSRLLLNTRHLGAGRYIAVLNDPEETEVPVARSKIQELRAHL